MNFIPYVFKKDLTRLKILLIVWLLLIAAQSALGIGGIKIASEILEFQMFLPMLTMLINALQGLMIIVMVPLIIQADSMVGTTAFWFTRPISRKALLITKLSFVLTVLVGMPLLAEMFVLAANGVMLDRMFLAIPEIILEKTAFIIPFVFLAVLTPKFSRYALVGIIVYVSLMVLGILSSIISIFIPGIARLAFNFDVMTNASLRASVKLAQEIFIVLGGGMLIVHQCLTRYTARTIRFFVVGYIVFLAISRTWAWDYLYQTTDKGAESRISDSVQLGFDTRHVLISEEMRYRKTDSREKSVSVKVFAKGLPENQFFILTELKDVFIIYSEKDSVQPKSALTPAGERTYQKETVKSGYVSTKIRESYTDEKFMPALQSALGSIKIMNPFYGDFAHTEILSLEDGYFNQYKDREGTYAAKADLDVYQYEKVAEVPLIQGAREAFSSQQIVVYDILEKPHGISVVVGEKRTNLLLDRTVKKESFLEKAQDMYSDFKSVYLIVNEVKGEAFLAESGGIFHFDPMSAHGQTRLETKAKQFDFTYMNDRNTVLPKIDEEWLTGAKLVRLDAVKLGSKRIDVKVDGFVLPTQSTSTKSEMHDLDQQLRQQDKQMKRQGYIF